MGGRTAPRDDVWLAPSTPSRKKTFEIARKRSFADGRTRAYSLDRREGLRTDKQTKFASKKERCRVI